jgi:RNA polymerase sigma-70 factor (ECF subfamily)
MKSGRTEPKCKPPPGKHPFMETTVMTLQETDCAGGAFCHSTLASLELSANEPPPQNSPPGSESENRDYLSLLESSAPEVHRFVAQRIANKADAEDIAQQVLLQALANLSTFRGKNFRAWLFTISRHLIIDFYRARGRAQFVEVGEEALREAEPSLRTRHDAVHTRCDCRAWLGQWVECITQQLRLEEQVAVLLADVHGYSDRASAGKLSMTVPSFKLLLHGARARLNKVSGGCCVLLNSPDDDGNGVNPGKQREGAEGRTCGGCAAARSKQSQTICHCSKGKRSATGALSSRSTSCCVGCGGCLSSTCCFGVNCRLGIKCCRQAPRLLELRTRLLRALILN